MKNNSPKPPLKFDVSQLFFMFVIFLVFAFFFTGIANERKNSNEISFETFIQEVKDGKVKSVTFKPPFDIKGSYKDEGINNLKEDKVVMFPENIPSLENKVKTKKDFKAIGNLDQGVYIKILQDNNLTPTYEKPGLGTTLLSTLFPFLIIFGVFYFFIKKSKGGVLGNISKAKYKVSTGSDVRFKDVAGVEEAKEELQEMVDYLSNPSKYSKIGGKIPKGALLVGPSGTGKTLLAKAVAGEANVPFLSMSGSDFVEMFVGVGASRVRDLFTEAKKVSPCIIFIDEIDAVGKARSSNINQSNDERDQTLNQLLVEMDGFESQLGIIVLAATNRVDVLDSALLRPGRFDRKVMVSLPDVKGREMILGVHAEKVKMAPSVDLHSLARGTGGMSGADLENLINEAALLGARMNKEEIDQSILEKARDKVLMGPERKSMVISEKEKLVTAYHEAGHAIVASILPELDGVHKVTIVPRGMALGVTQTLPEDNQLSLNNIRAENMISMLMGGRVAEEIIYNHYTTGASNDIERATSLVRRMVTEWGMSSLGPLNFNPQGYGEFTFSEKTKELVDEEMKKIMARAIQKTHDILMENRDKLEKMAQLLMEKETITGEDVKNILKN